MSERRSRRPPGVEPGNAAAHPSWRSEKRRQRKFVDTCHAGGLSGRNDDLALEVGDGVYVIASSGAREYSYESEKWGHGAFTLALLRSLDRRDLASEGSIRFGALAYAVSDGVASLMRAAGLDESRDVWRARGPWWWIARDGFT